jgi:hypothetical protein
MGAKTTSKKVAFQTVKPKVSKPKRSNKGAPVPMRFKTTQPPKLSATSEGILLDPKQTLDDNIDKVNEVSPTFTLLSTRCTTESNFDAKTVHTLSFGFALPHLVTTKANVIADDPRGALVEMLRTGVSFKNVSNQDVKIYANLPIAKQTKPGQIYTRISGFHAKHKKGDMTDDITLQPDQTGTFKVHLKRLANEYVPMEQVKEGRVWINIITFCVVMKNVNQETGGAYNKDASILEARPKALYTIRKSHPQIPTGGTLVQQDTENFVLQAMSGYTDLFSVDPVSAIGGSPVVPAGQIPRSIAPQKDIFRGGDIDATFIQDAAIEGDLIGFAKVLVTSKTPRPGVTYLDHPHPPYSYYTAGLKIKRIGGHDRPLELSGRHAGGHRLIVMGLNSMSNPKAPQIYYSYWKWNANVGHWILWDDFEQQARYVDENLAQITPVSSAMPIVLLENVYTKEERLEIEEELIKTGFSATGLPYGRPQSFGEFLRKAISVLEVVGKIAGFTGTLL